MQLPNKNSNTTSARTVAILGVFLALILIVGLVERMIPLDFIVPGVRLGFSNVVILLSLYIFRLRSVLCLVLLKCLMLALVAGSVSSLFYSLCGSVLSFFIMAAVMKLGRERISPVGISVVGAVFHSLGQLIAAAIILETLHIFTLFPVLTILSGISGALVGVMVTLALPALIRFRGRTPT